MHYKPSPAEVAWAAGLFEGEGCFSTTGKVRKHLRLAVASTDRDVLERFALIVGSGSIITIKSRESHHKQCWSWRSTSIAEANAVATLLEPWLCARRRERLAEIRKQASESAPPLRVCPAPRCGREFRPRTYHVSARFCSRSCGERGRRAEARARR